jgi:hypothetical protein
MPITEISPEPIVEAGELVFDGSECTVSVPKELSPGNYSIVLKNQTEEDVNIFVSRHAGDTTFQDVLDLQGEPGESLTYALYDELFNAVIEPRSAWEKPDGAEVHTYKLISKGEHVVGVWIYETAETDAMRTWFCAPFWVIEAPSE